MVTACAPCGMQAVLQAYDSGASLALIMEDDMEVLRWPSASLLFTAPPEWDALLLYMMGPDADAIYRWVMIMTWMPCGSSCVQGPNLLGAQAQGGIQPELSKDVVKNPALHPARLFVRKAR